MKVGIEVPAASAPLKGRNPRQEPRRDDNSSRRQFFEGLITHKRMKFFQERRYIEKRFFFGR
jgi:hypothetical protein